MGTSKKCIQILVTTEIEPTELFGLFFFISGHHESIFCWILQILAKRVSLFDYELFDGDQKKRIIAFGKFAGLAAMIDLLSGLGKRKHLIFPAVDPFILIHL